MKKHLFIILAILLPFEVISQRPTPVFIANPAIDSSLYDINYDCFLSYCPDPITRTLSAETYFIKAYRKKNSNQFDIYSFYGKCGSSIVQLINDTNYLHRISFSRTMLDNDSGWEAIVIYDGAAKVKSYYSKVFDDDGTEILSDSGVVLTYGFDGNDTYVMYHVDMLIYSQRMKAWRFRTNVFSSSSMPVSRTKPVSFQQIQIRQMIGGNYRVSIQNVSDDVVNFQMVNLLGKLVFSKKVNNSSSVVTFIIPEKGIPAGPFIAKVNDGDNTTSIRHLFLK